MEVTDAIDRRRSIRRFKNKEIPEGMLKEVLRAGHMAPSAGNLQARDYIIVQDNAVKELLAMAAHNQYFIMSAPVCIVVCANVSRSSARYGKRGELYAVQDASAAIMNMMLMAQNLELGTCWIGAFNEAAITYLLELPSGVRPVALLPIGYPDESPEAPPRMGEAAEHWGKW
ncbi:MAG TPA: nitroreductase family protein [Methanocella sp.]|uniref:nitroreductase family protein n=1 Tax=Methanocella sp. TaxID=2052833 RepID=UPI002C2642F2|nr:nitroreductase family protein [Methanocella sp.]HTY91381.1 nitroreductase family protein [Methanocella sp.]